MSVIHPIAPRRLLYSSTVARAAWTTVMFCIFLLFTPLASAQYTFTTIDFPGAAETIVQGINNHGVIVGEYGQIDFSNPAVMLGNKGFVFDGETYESLQVPGSLSTTAAAINDDGVIIGAYVDATGRTRGFLYDGTEYHDIFPPQAVAATFNDINNAGVVVGAFTETDFQAEATGVRFDGTDFEEVAFGNAAQTFLSGNNNLGQEVGTFISTSPPQAAAFILPSSDVFAHPDATVTAANDINDDGIVVGTFNLLQLGASGLVVRTKAYLYDSNSPGFSTIDLPGPECTFALANPTGACMPSLAGVNNTQTIVGYFDNNDGEYHGFVGTRASGGDFDLDGEVGGQDLMELLLGFGIASGATISDGDADGDGDVDRNDFAIWQMNAGSANTLFEAQDGASTTSVPEASTLTQFFLMLLAAWLPAVHIWSR